MSRRTALDFVNEARKVIGYPSTTAITDTELLGCLTDAVMEVFWNVGPRKFPLTHGSETVNTVDGTDSYELTETGVILHPYAVVDTTSGTRLQVSNQDDYIRNTQGGADNSPGTPFNWFESGVGSNGRPQIFVYPQPDGVYALTVHYFYFTEPVLSPSPTSLTFPWCIDVVIQKLTNKNALEYKDPAEAARYNEKIVAPAMTIARKYEPATSEKVWHLESVAGKALSGAY